MKKILCALSTAMMSLAAQANSVAIQNLLSNNIYVRFICINPDGTIHHSALTTLPPGGTNFINPTLIPGLAGIAAVNGQVISCYGTCTPSNLLLGSPVFGSGAPPAQFVPAGNACNGNSFDMFWNEASAAPYNCAILIM